jgi:hypothetical protein
MPRADAFGVFRSNENWHKKPGRPRRNDCTHALQKISDEQIAAALNACDGIIKDACVNLNANYYTIEPRIRKTPILRQLLEIYRNRAFDFTESHLRKANKKGEAWAIKEMLKYRGHNHGFSEKQQHEISGSLSLTKESVHSLTDEELDAILIRLDRRIADLAGSQSDEG